MIHVAIIPDGNRRWARAKGFAASKGHEHAGQRESLKALLKEAKSLGIGTLSLWVFSTENWKRPKHETTTLFKILNERIKDLETDAIEEDVRVKWIGRRDRVPKDVVENLEKVESLTKSCGSMNFLLCLDYGGRDEIIRAVNQAVKNKEDLSEESFSNLLDTDEFPDVDLIIRTSGEKRLSGFMPWQAIYAELFFVEKHFPEFGPEDLRECVQEFKGRDRRFGGN